MRQIRCFFRKLFTPSFLPAFLQGLAGQIVWEFLRHLHIHASLSIILR